MVDNEKSNLDLLYNSVKRLTKFIKDNKNSLEKILEKDRLTDGLMVRSIDHAIKRGVEKIYDKMFNELEEYYKKLREGYPPSRLYFDKELKGLEKFVNKYDSFLNDKLNEKPYKNLIENIVKKTYHSYIKILNNVCYDYLNIFYRDFKKEVSDFKEELSEMEKFVNKHKNLLKDELKELPFEKVKQEIIEKFYDNITNKMEKLRYFDEFDHVFENLDKFTYENRKYLKDKLKEKPIEEVKQKVIKKHYDNLFKGLKEYKTKESEIFKALLKRIDFISTKYKNYLE